LNAIDFCELRLLRYQLGSVRLLPLHGAHVLQLLNHLATKFVIVNFKILSLQP